MGSVKDSIKATVVAAGAYILVKKILDSPDVEKHHRTDREGANAVAPRQSDPNSRRQPQRHTRRYSRSYSETTS
ncbi:hypothetical protein CGMCC3_g9853 [Colletotrichum fructicola]|nr:uncharacterized protein CGMCC3_g9853 [Colletotrichum fructicola]KAE9574203.1 hypothetical protein CGMCC3_g9853 [Colletotrichum fructicola]KAF4430884.1 hypothetical protein CFRS1_v009601 [Colletotrichum fructicola]